MHLVYHCSPVMLSTLCRPLHLIVNHSSSLVKKLFSAFRIPATIYRHEIFECRVQPLIGDLQCIYCYFPLLHLIGSPSLGFPLGSTIFLHFFGSIAIPIFCSLSQPVLCSTVALCPLQWVKDWQKNGEQSEILKISHVPQRRNHVSYSFKGEWHTFS